MVSTIDILKKVQEAIGNNTTYGVAKALETSISTVRHWQKGRPMTDRAALRAAALTGLDTDFVMASLAAERAQNKQDEQGYKYWMEKVNGLGMALLSVTTCFFTVFFYNGLPF